MGASAWATAYSLSEQTSAGWSEVTSTTDLSTAAAAGNYFILIDAGTSNYAVTFSQSFGSGWGLFGPYYQETVDPREDAGELWTLEATTGDKYYIRNVSSKRYPNHWDWWMVVTPTADSEMTFAYGDSKWTISGTQGNVGPWNDDSPRAVNVGGTTDAVKIEGYERIAANKSSGDPGFKIYTISKANFVAWSIAGASEASPKNVSFYITNPSFENMEAIDGWSQSGSVNFVLQTNKAFSGMNGGIYVENYQDEGSLDIYQTLTDLPGGLYTLSVHASAPGGGYVYAGDDKTAVTGTNNDYSVSAVSTGSLKIGFSATKTNANELAGWTAIDNFRLYYQGPAIASEAVAFSNGIALTANQWYYIDIPTTKTYTITASSNLNNIVYTTDGKILLENESTVTSNFTDGQELTAGRYYFKSSEEQTFSFAAPVSDITDINSVFDYSTAAAYNVNNKTPFQLGSMTHGTNVYALRFAGDNSCTTSAFFDSDTETAGRKAYTLGSNEKVTFTINALHGYINAGSNGTHKTATISIKNSTGVALASYVYDGTDKQISEVKIGGNDPNEEFSAFAFCSRISSSNCNGFTNNAYQNDATRNPVITISITGNGDVTMNFALSNTGINNTYTGTLSSSVLKDLSQISIVDYLTSSDRAYAIQKLTIASTPLVTFKYEDTEGNSLSEIKADATIESTVGASIADLIASNNASFYNGDESKRYDYSTYTVSDDATTVPAGGATVTLKFAPKEKCAYNVKAVSATGAELFTIQDDTYGYEGDEVTVPYNRYYWVTSNQTLMEANAISSSYKYTFTIDSEELNKTITYNATTIGRVVYYSEAEDIDGATIINQSGNLLETTGSGGKGAASTNGVVFTNLPAGSYKVYYRQGGKYSTTNYLYIYAGETEVVKVSAAGTLSASNADFTLEANTDISFKGGVLGGQSANSYGFDYIYIVQTSTYTTTATIGSTGYTTFSSPYPLNLATLSSSGDAITAYYAASDAISGSTVKLTSTSGKVPANTGLILKGTAGDVATITATSTSETTALTGNLLVGCDVATKLSTNANYYVLVNNGGAEFQSLEDYGATIPAGKAYLNATVAESARALKIVFGDESTGIDTVNSEEVKVKSYYNLSGQRVAAPQKGLYIVNGKKVQVK